MPEPVSAVAWLTSSTFVVGYKECIEIVNINGASVKSFQVESGHVIDISCFLHQNIVWLEQSDKSYEEIRLQILDPLSDKKTTVTVPSIGQSSIPQVFSTQNRIFITNQSTNSLLVMDLNGRTLRELRIPDMTQSLLAVDRQKSYFFFSSQEGVVRAFVRANSDQLVVGAIGSWIYSSTIDQKNKFLPTVMKTDPKSEIRFERENEGSLSSPESIEENDTTKTKTEFTNTLRSNKYPDENGCYYMMDLQSGTSPTISVISSKGRCSKWRSLAKRPSQH